MSKRLENFFEKPLTHLWGAGVATARFAFGLVRRAIKGSFYGILAIATLLTINDAYNNTRLFITDADTPRYERTVQMYQQDLDAVSSTLQQLADNPRMMEIRDSWNTLGNEARLDALKEVQSIFIAHYPGFEAPYMHDSDMGAIVNNIAAGALEIKRNEDGTMDTSKLPSIWLNAEYLADMGFDKGVDTTIHETTHGVQFQLVQRLEKGEYLTDWQRKEAETFQHAANTYPIPIFSSFKYYINALEEQAHLNGNCSAFALQAALGQAAWQRADAPLDAASAAIWQNLTAGTEQPIKASVKACYDEHKAGYKLTPSLSMTLMDWTKVEVSAADVKAADDALAKQADTQVEVGQDSAPQSPAPRGM